MARDSIVTELGRTLGGYISGQLKIAAIVGCLYAIGFAVSGVPGWFLVGALGGLLQFVPVLGSLIALLLAAFATLLGQGELYNYLGVLATFVIVQGLEGFVLTPKLLGKSVGMKPIWVFLAIAIGGFAFGPLGIILAVPALAMAAVLWRRARRRSA